MWTFASPYLAYFRDHRQGLRCPVALGQDLTEQPVQVGNGLVVGEDVPADHVLGVRGAVGDDELRGVGGVPDRRENLESCLYVYREKLRAS